MTKPMTMMIPSESRRSDRKQLLTQPTLQEPPPTPEQPSQSNKHTKRSKIDEDRVNKPNTHIQSVHRTRTSSSYRGTTMNTPNGNTGLSTLAAAACKANDNTKEADHLCARTQGIEIDNQDTSDKKRKASDTNQMMVDPAACKDPPTTNLPKTFIRTDPVFKLKNHILAQLTKEQVSEAKMSFKDMVDLHDALRINTRSAVKHVHEMELPSQDFINKCLREGLSGAKWIEFFTNLCKNTIPDKNDTTDNDMVKGYIDFQEITAAKIFLSKLAYTNPNKIFDVSNNQTLASNGSRAWFAANHTIGSYWTKKPKSSDLRAHFATAKDVITASVITPQKGPKTGKTPTQTKPTSAPKTQTKLQVSSTPKETAANIASTRTHSSIRVTTKITIDTEGKNSPNTVMIRTVKDMFATFQERDASIVLLPWKIKDLSTTPAIIRYENIPDSAVAMRKYTDQFRPKNGSDNWIRFHFASDGSPNNVTHSALSENSDWFDANDSQGYLCPVQGSDDPAPIGVLLYSGGFVDKCRIKECIQQAILAKTNKPYEIGVRNPTCKELKNPNHNGRYEMRYDQPMLLEADRKTVHTLKTVLYELFNKEDDRNKRPGGYNFRLVPDARLIRSGLAGTKQRAHTFKKHQAIIQSLNIIESEHIKELDKEMTFNGKKETLRTYIATLTFPLVPDENAENKTTTTPLFHSVDLATGGKPAQKGATLFTAYSDRFDVAQRVVYFLPSLVDRFLSTSASDAWFHATGLASRNEATFIVDDITGKWTGDWTTVDDQESQKILAEKTDTNIHLDLSHLLTEKPSAALNVHEDDLSLHSFGTSFGRNETNASQTTGKAAAGPPVDLTATGDSGGEAV